MEHQEAGENRIVTVFIICTPRQILLEQSHRGCEMGRVCSMLTKFWWEILNERESSEDLSADKKVILNDLKEGGREDMDWIQLARIKIGDGP